MELKTLDKSYDCVGVYLPKKGGGSKAVLSPPFNLTGYELIKLADRLARRIAEDKKMLDNIDYIISGQPYNVVVRDGDTIKTMVKGGE